MSDVSGIYTPPPSLQEVTANACSVHIAERVKLNWMIAGSENQGIASLKGITLTSAMMDLIAVSPLQWGMYYPVFENMVFDA